MQIFYTENFKNEIMNLTAYIAISSLQNAINFEKELKAKIKNIPPFPFSYRENLQLNDKNIRDLIFKGYVVPFLVFNGDIYVLGIYKQNLWKPNFGEIKEIKKDKI